MRSELFLLTCYLEPLRLKIQVDKEYFHELSTAISHWLQGKPRKEPKEKPAQEAEKPRGKPKRETTTGDSQGKLDTCDLCAGRVGELSALANDA